MENQEMDPQEPEDHTVEVILDILEVEFRRQEEEQRDEPILAELTVLEPGGERIIRTVLVESYNKGTLYVSKDEHSPVMPIEIGRVKKINLVGKEN